MDRILDEEIVAKVTREPVDGAWLNETVQQ